MLPFEDPTDSSTQLTWAVLSQGFRDSLHLFRQASAKDLADLGATESIKLIQYIDDSLLCADTEKKKCNQATCDLLNYLAGCGYKISKSKAQMCQQEIRYLGFKLSHGAKK